MTLGTNAVILPLGYEINAIEHLLPPPIPLMQEEAQDSRTVTKRTLKGPLQFCKFALFSPLQIRNDFHASARLGLLCVYGCVGETTGREN